MANMIFMAYDGDNAGRMCGRAILADDPKALHEISNRINLGHQVVKKWVEARGGQFISGGGDEGVFSIPEEAIQEVEKLRADFEFATNLTATIGIGNTLSEAGKAMLVGKFRGKNQAVQFDPSIEAEIKQAEEKLSQGTASAEEKKIGEAYLQPEGKSEMANEQDKSNLEDHSDCEYCREMDSNQTDDPNHCRYCHDEENLEEPCQYCQEAEGAPSEDPSEEECAYCADNEEPVNGDNEVEPTEGPAVENPTTTDSENYEGQDLNDPDAPKPPAIQPNPDGLSTSLDTPSVENTKQSLMGPAGSGEVEVNDEGTPTIDPQSEETAQDITEQIDQIPPEDTQIADNTITTDDADMAIGTAMEDGVSRPEDYADENNPKDMGLAEEENQDSPDLTSLMQEGLDNHADDIAKEKVVSLVTEALMGFKASKAILEKAKTQAPQLYESSIAMLKAMIEMAKMLGLGQEEGEQTVSELEEPSEGHDQMPEGEAPPPEAHTGEGQNPMKPAKSDLPEYEKKNDKPAPEDGGGKKQKGQSANQ